MPLPSSLVGATTEPRATEVDARWTMAYAAGIGDTNPRYLDTTRPGGVVAHPLFAVAVEWPAVLDARRLTPLDVLPLDEAARGVHATHDLTVHRLVRPGDVLTTTATIVAVERRSPGAYQVLRLATIDADGEPVATTHMGSLFLGVDVQGEDSSSEALRPLSAAPLAVPSRRDLPLAAGAAHVYTECARIWNPIHTDVAVARAAGLPDVILHGTATLAMAVSAVVDERAGGDPTAVRIVQARFAAPVLLPSTIGVHIGSPASDHVPFTVTTVDGRPAVRDGLVALHR